MCNLNHSNRGGPAFSTTGQITRGKIVTGGWIYICLAAVHRRNIHGLRAISGFVRRGGSGGRGRWQREKREREKEEEKRKEGKKNRKIEE